MARRLGPQDPELETILESVGELPDGESTLHVKVNTIDSEVGVIDGIVDAILADTGTDIPASIAVVDGIVDSILEDTGTTLPGTLATIEGKVDGVAADVDQALLDVAAVKGVVDAVLVDTGTDIPAAFAVTDGKVDGVKTVVDAIAADVGDFTGASTTLKDEIASIKTIVDGISTASGNFTVLLEEQLERPDSGTRDYIYTIMHRVNGVMTSLDAAPTVDLDYSDGTEANTLLYNDEATPVQSTTATEKSTGYYQGRIRVAVGTAVGPMIFVVTGAYNSATLKQARGTRVDESFTLAWNSTDATRLQNASANTDQILLDVANLDGDVAAVKAETALIKSDSTAILEDTVEIVGDVNQVLLDLAVVDGNVDDIEIEIAKIESKDTNLTFDRATDSLEAISEKLDTMAASSGVVFRAVKTSGAIANGANEVVALTPSEGFDSSHAKIYNVKVLRATGDCTKFSVELYEDAAATKLLAAWTGLTPAKPLNDNLGGYVYWNQDLTNTNYMWVKVINNDTAASSSTFSIEVRGDLVG